MVLTEAGRGTVAVAAETFAADVTAVLGVLSAAERRTLAGLAERLTTGHADRRDVDIATVR